MPKNKRPVARKSSPSPEDLLEAITQKLSELAITLVEQEEYETMPDALREQDVEFHKTIRKCLLQQRDEALYEALERTRYADDDGYRLLRRSIEEAAEVITLRRENGQDVEINAFAVPFFVRSTGGLRIEQCFQDQEAFDALWHSLKQDQLESADATVVLVAHAYHFDEIDKITFCQLNEMTRDAQAAMTGKKGSTAAIGKSFSGWPPNTFGAQDAALELRFLLGFALKSAHDPFYAVPEDEAAVDAYFDVRARRFERWSERVAPILTRALVTDGRELELSFLYQDLFFGAKQRAMAEHAMLHMMSQLNVGLEQSGLASADADAIVGPADVNGELVLRVNLYGGHDGPLLASAERSLADVPDLDLDIADTCDALASMGVRSCSLAHQFDAWGKAQDVRAYP